MKFNKKAFLKSLYKISVVLFLIGYNFAPSFLAIDHLRDIGGEITPVAAADTTMVAASSSGKWTEVDKGYLLKPNTLNTNFIKWDYNANPPSGLEFIGKDTSVNIDAEGEFVLGTLKHHNNPINQAITTAKLAITIDLGDPVGQQKVFKVDFTIDETRNYANESSCATWHTPGNPPCDDMIEFTTVHSREYFVYGDKKYVLEITGFIQNGQNVNQFITKEEATSEAEIRGRFRSVQEKVTICHRTSDHDGPYIVNTPNANGHVDGHNGHNGKIWYPGIQYSEGWTPNSKWGDIIPEFRYFDENGDVQVYPGKNNSEYGLSILANGCVFPEGKVTVNKEIIAPAGETDTFAITGTGTPTVPDVPTGFNGFKGNNTGTISPTTPATFNVYPGKYTFNETQKEGWIETGNTCNDIVVGKGDEKTCTITNTKASTLTIVKHAEQVSDTAFNFTAKGTGLSNFSLVDNDANNDPEKVFTNLLPGNYSVTEDTKDGWDLKSAVCDNGQAPNALNLTAGSNVTCTFTNTQRGSLTIVKKALPFGTDSFGFTLTGNGVKEEFNLVDNSDTEDASETFTLKAGTYAVAEDDYSDDWKTTYSCTGNNTIDNIVLAAGKSVTCTFTNTKYGSISGHKWDDLDGIPGTEDDKLNPIEGWTIFIDANNNDILDAGETSMLTGIDGKYSFTKLEPGTYKIMEVLQLGWINITGKSQSVTITAGENRKDVDFSNVKYPTIQVIKNVDTDGNGTVDKENVKDWTWKIGADEYDTGINPVEKMPGTYTISEVQKPNYHVTSLVCKNNGIDMGVELGESVGITLKSGDNVVCTFTNTRDTSTLIVRKEVTNDYGGELEAGKFSFKIDGGEGIGFKQDPTNPLFAENKYEKYPTGTYSITEIEENLNGYKTTYDNCKKIVVEKGKEAICTIKNDDIAPELTVIKNVKNEGNDGTKKAENFEITVDGKNVSTPTFNGSENGVTVTLDAGSYEVTEDEDTENYKAEYSKDCSGKIGLGEKKTCTITNTGIDHMPEIVVTKTAGVTEIPETGGKVTFTYEVTNTGAEPVEITSLYDDKYGETGGNLNGDDDCQVGTVLAVGASCEFEETLTIPANKPGDPNPPTTHKNIFTAKAKDDEGNEVPATDEEVITLTPVPSLKLVKNVVHKYNSDTSITAADWTLYATGDGGFDYAGDTDEFRFVKAGVEYNLSEEGIYSPRFEASNWVCNGVELTGSTLTLAADDDVVCTITNTALPATVTVYKDVLDGFSNDIFKVQLEKDGEIQDISDTEDANKRLVAVFEGLDCGTYNPREVELPDGYIAQGCVPLEGSSYTVENGMGIEFVCINEVINPILQIEKSNDKQSINQYAGDIVTYTITVTAPDDKAEGTYVLNDVIVSDIAPAGFKYILGSWTAQKNGVNISVTEPTYNDANVAQWMIGNMKEGDKVVLTYKTKISLLQDPGNYPDIAWVSGTSLIDGAVLGASTADPLTPFVGTDVTVIDPIETEEGEVLGASITLPVTGASTYLTLGALIMMILGAITLLLKPFKKLSYALLTGLMAVSFVTLLTPNRVLAADEDIKVRIMQPATPTKKSNFNVGFVALDTNSEPITVECYKDAVLFETIPNVNTGNCSAKVDASGTYTFYVVAKSISGEQKSADVTVVVDLEKPSPVIDYSKAGNVIKFKTPNDGKTKKVEIHRSTTSKYTANEGTRVHSMDVSPNTEYSWTDTTAEAGKTYYYALRTVDAVGNVSTIVSDPEVVEVPTISTPTATTTTGGEVAGQKDTTEEGEVAGETDDVSEGEDQEVEKTEDSTEKTDIKETAKKAAGKWYIWVIAIVVIGGVAYYVRKQKRD